MSGMLRNVESTGWCDIVCANFKEIVICNLLLSVTSVKVVLDFCVAQLLRLSDWVCLE